MTFQEYKKAIKNAHAKKPHPAFGNWFWCPNCERSIKRRIRKSTHDILYCPFCGQKLDWGQE